MNQYPVVTFALEKEEFCVFVRYHGRFEEKFSFPVVAIKAAIEAQEREQQSGHTTRDAGVPSTH